ncbi:MAG: fumarylacetoacetate hydrolase family protein [Thermodesulfobacteriota bacterium]
MKLATYEVKTPLGRFRRLGAVLENHRILDLQLAYGHYLNSKFKRNRGQALAAALMPTDILEFLDGGAETLALARETEQYALELLDREGRLLGPGGEQIIYEPAEVILKAPVPRPGKIIHTGGNFGSHVKEFSETGWGEYREWNKKAPTGFLEAPNIIIGPDEPIIYPRLTRQLDYEIEMAIVIGRRGRYISREKAFDHIAGYTIFNDISARDVQAVEHANRMIMLGKSMDTFGPLGPFLVLKDEIDDPDNLGMVLKVNGEVRQEANTSDMVFSVAEMVAHWSGLTLEPGDIITTGTPSGVAAFREPDPEPYFLKPGDVIEAEVEKIGLLRNPVVAESD